MAFRTLVLTTTVFYGLLGAHSHPATPSPLVKEAQHAPIQEAVDVPDFAFAPAGVAPPEVSSQLEAFNDSKILKITSIF